MNENARDIAPRRDRVDVRITGLQQEDFKRLFETATLSSRLPTYQDPLENFNKRLSRAFGDGLRDVLGTERLMKQISGSFHLGKLAKIESLLSVDRDLVSRWQTDLAERLEVRVLPSFELSAGLVDLQVSQPFAETMRRLSEQMQLTVVPDRTGLRRIEELIHDGEIPLETLAEAEADLLSDAELSDLFERAATEWSASDPSVSREAARMLIVGYVWLLTYCTLLWIMIAVGPAGAFIGPLGLGAPQVAKAAGKVFDHAWPEEP